MILDTNAYGALQTAEPKIVALLAQTHAIFLPLPVIAELKAGFLKGSRAPQNMYILDKFLSAPNVDIIYPLSATVDRYADLQVYCWKHGRSLSNNDIWIAALSLETDDLLVTYDHDFEIFQVLMGDKLIILETDS